MGAFSSPLSTRCQSRSSGPRRAVDKRPGCDSGSAHLVFSSFSAAWKTSEFSKWPLATFPPPSGRGQGLSCVLGDLGCHSDLRRAPPPWPSCTEACPKEADTALLVRLRGRGGQSATTQDPSSQTSQEPSGDIPRVTQRGLCVCVCVCV